MTGSGLDPMMEILMTGNTSAVLAELVDALDSGSSVRKDFRVRVSGTASVQEKESRKSTLLLFY